MVFLRTIMGYVQRYSLLASGALSVIAVSAVCTDLFCQNLFTAFFAPQLRLRTFMKCIWRYSGLADRAFCELAYLTMLINFVEWEQFPALPAFSLTESWWWLFGTIMSLTWPLPLPTVTALSKSVGFLMLCNFFWFEIFATAGTFLLYSSV
jgi:hypothetical protein